MTKTELKEKTEKRVTDTKEALELVISCITAKGQRKKIAGNEKAKALLEFYGIELDVE